MHVEIAARIGELGRQPRAARQFIEKYQDRVLFGTDAIPGGTETPQQIFNDQLYEIYYRFLETDDEYFDYAPQRPFRRKEDGRFLDWPCPNPYCAKSIRRTPLAY